MTRRRTPRIHKRSGKVEPYREQKLRRALRRVGVPPADRDRVVGDVERVLDGDVGTATIDRTVARALRRAPAPCAARWNLRRALFALGPSGFPFEHFVGALFAAMGYRTRIGVRLQGHFISHEIDVDATRKRERALCECKLLTRRDGKIDAKIALYVYGRAVDLDALRDERRFWLVTNGRFTADAQRFGEGMGLRLLGWDAPKGDGLRSMVEELGVMPITALTTLPAAARLLLLRRGHVLCRDLTASPQLLEAAGLGDRQVQRVLAEARAVTACLTRR